MKTKKLVCKEVLNLKLQKEINAHKVEVDKTVFSKTDEEKALLKQLKKSVNIDKTSRKKTFFSQVTKKRLIVAGSRSISVW